MYRFVRIFPLSTDFVQIFSLVDIRPLFSVLLLPKVPIVLTNASNKNCIKFNFLKKVIGCMSLSPLEVEQGAPKTCQFWDRALEWESMFTLWRNTAKSTNYIEKCFKQKLSKIIFPTKISWSAYVCLPY